MIIAELFLAWTAIGMIVIGLVVWGMRAFVNNMKPGDMP